jgi:hypothetical protein
MKYVYTFRMCSYMLFQGYGSWSTVLCDGNLWSPMFETQSASVLVYIDFLHYSSQSVSSWRELRKAGDKNPYGDEGNTVAKMKVVWDWGVLQEIVTGSQDGREGMAQDAWHSWAWRHGPAQVSKTDEVSAHTVRRIRITLYQGMLQREGEVLGECNLLSS